MGSIGEGCAAGAADRTRSVSATDQERRADDLQPVPQPARDERRVHLGAALDEHALHPYLEQIRENGLRLYLRQPHHPRSATLQPPYPLLITELAIDHHRPLHAEELGGRR